MQAQETKSLIPAFRYFGGKVKSREWLVCHFPRFGRDYIEPFVGLANVYYYARTQLNFEHWILSDIDVFFLEAIRAADIESVPDSVDRDDFEVWRYSPSFTAKILEPSITFGGKGYANGFNSGQTFHGHLHRRKCYAARHLLTDAIILQRNWKIIDWFSIKKDDFVYFDPPYYGTKSPYPNIDHGALIKTANNLKCRWAISGYDNQFYTERLEFKRKVHHDRDGGIKQSNSGAASTTTETLWMNY